MKIKQTFTLLLLVIASTSFAQTYYDHVATADKLYQEKKYKESAKAYEAAFKTDTKKSATDLYNCACTWALAGKKSKALKNLILSTEHGYTNTKWMQEDTDLAVLQNNKKFKNLVSTLEAKQAAFEATLNQSLKKELGEIMEKDQRHRKNAREYREKYGQDADEYKELWVKQNELDSLNELRVIEIIDEYGYPGKSLVGDQSSVAFFVIQHANLETQEKYLPILTAAAEKGELRYSSLALLIDRVNVSNDRKQIYGTQIGMEDGKYIIRPIEDEKNVNKRREKVGLGPLEHYVKRWGIEYTLPKE